MTSHLLTVVRSLCFSRDRTAELETFSDADWEALLPLCDRSHLTLPLGVRAIHRLPAWVRERIKRNLADNAMRHTRADTAYREIAAAFAARGVEYVVLKGFSQYPHYCSNLRYRPQYDLDIYCPPGAIQGALECVTGLGYTFFRRANSPMDHLPPLIRKTGWRPGTDYFDPEMPLTVELHFRFWDPETERFHPRPGEAFWARRISERYGSLEFPALSPDDRFSYAAWHLIRHLVRGDLRAYHVYEIAHFLDATATNDEWWSGWSRSRPSGVEALAFLLAREWFDCRLHPLADRLVELLPSPVHRWFEDFSFSPLTAWEHPNKDELFLHLSLVHGFRDRIHVLRRRLIPIRFQPPVLDAHVPSPSRGLRWKRGIFGVWFMAKRSIFHLRALFPVLRSAIRWHRALVRQPSRRLPRKLPSENAAR